MMHMLKMVCMQAVVRQGHGGWLPSAWHVPSSGAMLMEVLQDFPYVA